MPLTTPALHTARLRLRPVQDADADDVFALHSSPRVLRYWDSPPWTERERAGQFVRASHQRAADGVGVRVAIDRLSDGAFLGWCSLNGWDEVYRSASLTYCLAERAWGHGYATEAATALLRWAYDTLDLNRVQAQADTRNRASARVLEKLGFVREGLLREDCIVNGDVSDSWVYGLLRREWAPPPEQRDAPRSPATVRELDLAGRDSALETLAAGFAGGGALRRTATPPFEQSSREFLGILLDICLDSGRVWVTDDLASVACWTTPEGRNGTELFARHADRMAELNSGDPGLAAAKETFYGRHRPDHPVWFLCSVATRPEARGRGLARSVIAPGLAAADAAGVEAYLEADDPSNVGFYESLGFEVVAHETLPGDVTPTVMVRSTPRH